MSVHDKRKHFDGRPMAWKPAVLVLALAMFSGSAVAGNGNGQGHGQGQGNGPERVQSQGHGGGNPHHNDDRGDHDRDRHEHGAQRHDGGTDINIDLVHGDIRDVFRDHRDWIDGPRESLPPGIRQNLARGKPLPPGIAKRVDSRFRDVLPHYDGYEWWVAGTTAILVNATNNIIEDVVEDIFY